jgi:hypothetical protein
MFPLSRNCDDHARLQTRDTPERADEVASTDHAHDDENVSGNYRTLDTRWHD